MSHFCVLVVTDEEPTDAVLSKALQPFHQYECTGTEDEYVRDVDVTDEVMKAWREPQKVVMLTTGKVLSKFDAQFWKGQEFCLPEGAAETTIPQNQLSAFEDESIEQWAEDYGGWFCRDGKWYRRTNPDAKWDYWTVGGRYTGRFEPAYDPNEDPENKEICFLCHGTGKRDDELGRKQRSVDPEYTCNGCGGNGKSVKWPTKWREVGNKIQVSELNKRMDALLVANRNDKAKIWDECAANYAKEPIGDMTFEEARVAWADLLASRIGLRTVRALS